MKIEPTCDWSLVRQAYPLDLIPIGGTLALRPLTATDAEALVTFMAGDPEMAWTRASWGPQNVKYLLEVRLQHYRNFGFGPYAILKSGTVVGMAGAQVWDYAPCAIEVLAYVARPLWSSGVAARALCWSLSRAREVGKQEAIYAAIRPENHRATRVAERMGFEPIGESTHYGHPAIHWRLPFPENAKL